MAEDLTTVAQDSWKELVAAMRVEYGKLLPKMAAMTPGELNSFAEAGRAILWFDVNAQTFDKEIELKLSQVVGD